MAGERLFAAVTLMLAVLPACAGGPATGEPRTAPAATIVPGRPDDTSRYAPEPNRREELRAMLIQDCGSCHGGTLKGGLGPPLTAEALAGRNPYELARVILDGRQGTPMAPWKLFLSEPEAAWLARQLLSGK
jgi:cytochrome c55X